MTLHQKYFLLILCLVLLKVYCSDHTYTTIRIAVAAMGREVVGAVADKLGTTDELLLVHLSSSGGKTVEPLSCERAGDSDITSPSSCPVMNTQSSRL